MQIRIMLLCLFCMSVSGTVTVANAQSIVSDSEKQKQWKSMENGPWDFAPDWYYFSCIRNTQVRKCTGNGTGSTPDSVSVSRNPSLM